MRPEVEAEVRDWLTRAEHDLASSQLLMNAEPPLYDVVVYHCQQAAEKALKSVLARADLPIPKVHNLVEIIGLCCQVEPAYAQFLSMAGTLSPYAYEYRYPGGPPSPTREEAEAALAMAAGILRFVQARL